MKTTLKKVTALSMPACNYSFRSGFARAIVDGVKMKLHTSKSACSDYSEHENEVREQFAQGEGELDD